MREGCVVITGAASGIGLAVAELLLERRPEIVIGAIDLPGEALEALSDRAAVVTAACDVTQRGAVRAAVDSFAAQAAIVGLVNAAGNHLTMPSIDLDEAGWHAVLGVHLDGTFYAAQAVATAMMEHESGGSMVNFSSVAMDFGWPSRLPYAVAKAGIGALTRTLAVEWADSNIRVNAIAPGYVNTPMIRDAAAKGAFDVAARVAGHAVKRFAEPREIAEVVEFLLSDRASFITGEVIRADGGFSAVK